MRARVVAVLIAIVAAAAAFLWWSRSRADDDTGDDVRAVVERAPVRAPVKAPVPAAPVPPAAPPPLPAAPPPAQAAGDDDARIELTVVDRSGAPLPSYELFMRAADWDRHSPPPKGFDRRGSLTRRVDDRDGRVTVDVPPGVFIYLVSAERYRDSGYARARARAGETTSVRVVLDASIALRGVVRDAQTGEPVAGARVTCRGCDGDTTGDDGHYELLSLPDARFRVHVSARGYRALDVGGVRGDHSRDEELDVELDALVDGGPSEEYVGTGFALGGGKDGQLPFVAKLFPDTPAAAVLHVGDVITDVDGASVRQLDVHETQELILGDADDSVRLDVLRDGQPLRFDVARARIPMPEKEPRLRHAPR